MDRPSIALACIVKNEEKNLPILLDSVKGCFDNIYICDTGSTDRTVEIAKEYGCIVTNFDWVNDFAAARNASFSPVKEEYVMWMDGDDSLNDPDKFIEWRDSIMNTADYWMASYRYAHNPKGEPVCTFLRERIFRKDFGFTWRYFIHEGVVPKDPTSVPKVSYVSSWSVRHRRSPEDLAKDKGRNLKIFEINKDNLDFRMKFYYGKELFENNMAKECIPHILDAVTDPKLEAHDRLLALQYCAYAMVQIGDYDKAISVSAQGTHLSPHRAEFWNLMGDSFIKKGDLSGSIPYYEAAKACHYHDAVKTGVASPLFNFKDLYTFYPRNMLARIYVQLGRMIDAYEEAKECYDLFGNDDTKALLFELTKIKSSLESAKTAKEVDEIIISCAPQMAYEWDYGIYKKQGIGGSETAAVEMAHWLHKVSGKKVKVFNNVSCKKNFDGVEYIPAPDLSDYLSQNKPYANIMWRHSTRMTEAPSYLWCHDLMTPGAEHKNYDRILVLSDFHKSFVKSLMNIPDDKIRVTRNGIDPDRFKGKPVIKAGNRVVFRSSPDRGLMRSILVMDEVRKSVPDAELHVFYGFDNMYKAGKGADADKMKELMNVRPWVKYHGNVEQKVLSRQCSEAKVWLYPANFEETYCISAIESLCEGVYPVVRKYGALKDTLKEAGEAGMATLISHDCETKEQIKDYADAVVCALKEDYWKKIKVDPDKWSWKSLAEEWLGWMGEDRGKSS